MLGAEGCLGIRNSSAAVLPPPQGKAVPTTQDDRNKNKGKDVFYSDWPELVLLDDFETALRAFDPSPTFEKGCKYVEDTLWSPICSAEVPGSYFDNISFSVDPNETATTLTSKQPANPTEASGRQSRNGASDPPLNCDAHTSSSSSLSDAEFFLQFDEIALANQMGGGCDGLEAIFRPSQPDPTASAGTVCSDETVASSALSGPDLATAAHSIPGSSEKPHGPFRGAPDMVLEEMAENPLDMYFPPVTAYEQPELLLLGDSAPAPEKHRSPREIYALNSAELQFCSKEMASVAFHGQPGSAVPVKDLGFHKLQEGMNRLDLATKGRIRDALYRLANSVEQRHRVGGSTGGVASSGSKRFRSGGWTETQLTPNPMDQSVAQLLLQKPPHQKTIPPHRVK
ncbi:hypothetical protein BS78_04G282700 [Paspalum vaginatum]|nr:hypothetical protein BS78_04G282700 [Paspalum vaginatum]